jgi:xanthine dehydrogenase accessory protein XdhC
MSITRFLDRIANEGEGAIVVEIARARGSTPREAGAAMVVSRDAFAGTIGGGQLEFIAIDRAREMLAGTAHAPLTLDLPLGPLLGQCCGGHVTLSLKPLDGESEARLRAADVRETAARPRIFVFGLGHTGRALARILALLPFDTTLVDDRPEVFVDLPPECQKLHLEDPAVAVATGPPGAAYVIFTHSHALDYRLADAALRREDAAYVGMIGSATKKIRFEKHFLVSGGTSAQLTRFTCPIGGSIVHDKRPEIIAALTAAELVAVFFAGKA